MNVFFGFIITVFCASALVILFFAIKSHRFLKTLIFNAFIGLISLAILNLTAFLTGAYIPINPYSVAGSAFFGVPFIGLMLILRIVFL